MRAWRKVSGNIRVCWDLPGVPMVKSLLFHGRDMDSIHGQNPPSCMPCGMTPQKILSDANDSWCESWTIKKAEHQRIDAFNCGAGEDLKSPLDRKKIKSVSPKGNQPWILIGRTDAEVEASCTLATWCEELTHQKRPWCWERLKAGGEAGSRGWDGWIASPHPSSWWCHPAISFSVVPFSSCPQSSPTSGSFLMSQFFTSGGQSIGVSASASVLPMNIQDWFPLGLTGLISLQSKGLSRVLSNTPAQKASILGAQLSLWSNSYIHTWLLEKP